MRLVLFSPSQPSRSKEKVTRCLLPRSEAERSLRARRRRGISGSVHRRLRERRMEAAKLLKDKKFWFASFLVVWAAALQGHMMWMRNQDAFKEKFRDLSDQAKKSDE